MYRTSPAELWRTYSEPCGLSQLEYVKRLCASNWPQAEVQVIQGASWAELGRARTELEVNSEYESPEDKARRKLEDGPGGDHDEPYRYRAPSGPWLPALIHLMERVQKGELEP